MTTFARGRREIQLLTRDPLLALLVVLLFVSLGVFVVFPLLSVLVKSFQSEQGAFSLENYTRFLTFSYSLVSLEQSHRRLCTAACSVLVGFAAAFTITRTSVPWKKALHLLFILPIISPFTSALHPDALRRERLDHSGAAGNPKLQHLRLHGVLLSQIFTFAPVAYLTLKGVMESLNPTLEDAAMNVGVGRLQTFLRVTLPLSLPGIASAFLVVLIESLADFGNRWCSPEAASPCSPPRPTPRSPARSTCRWGRSRGGAADPVDHPSPSSATTCRSASTPP